MVCFASFRAVRRLGRTLAGLTAVSALCGCTTAPQWKTELGFADLVASETASVPAADPAALPRQGPGVGGRSYLIGPGDELNVTVWGPRDVWEAVQSQDSPQANRTVTVQDDGGIVLPLVRKVVVGGLSISDALARIGEAYRKVAGARFQVDGSIAHYRSQVVLVEGAVTRPGVAYLAPDLQTLGQLVSGTAGGLTDNADATKGLLVRGEVSYHIDYQAAQSGGSDVQRIALLPGDRVFFPARGNGTVYVFGEVGQQSEIPIPVQGITLLQALLVAKGPLYPTANLKSLFLVRSQPDKEAVYQFALQDALDAHDVPLQPGDRVYVPVTGLTNWERTVRQALPILGSATITTH